MSKIMMFEGPRKLSIKDVPDKALEPKQVRIKSLYSAISHGTEMNVYRGLAPMYSRKQDFATKLFVESDKPTWQYPIPYGYTLTGEVVECGSAVTKLKVGDKIFCYESHGTGCVLPEDVPIRIPDGIDPKFAVFNANLNTSLNGILDAGIRLGDRVAVFGQGVIGLMALQMAKKSGADPVVVVDMFSKRLELSKKLGADVMVNPAKCKDVALEIKKATANQGVDIAIELSGSDRALNEAIRSVVYNGKVVVLGWYANNLTNVNLAGEFHHNRVQLIGSQVGGMNPCISSSWNMGRRQEMVWKLMRELELKSFITHEIDFQDIAAAYELVDTKAEEIIQVLIKY